MGVHQSEEKKTKIDLIQSILVARLLCLGESTSMVYMCSNAMYSFCFSTHLCSLCSVQGFSGVDPHTYTVRIATN